MSDLPTVPGFEDVWRPPIRLRRRSPEPVLRPGQTVRARLDRIVRRAPEVMVKVTGRTRSPDHLRAHLDYISRNGDLELEAREGALLVGRGEVRDLADDWSAAGLFDSRRRANTPFSLSVVLSMPVGIEAVAVRDAARAFAREMFASRFDYVLVLHTDAGHPHVHLAVRALGDSGERLNPKKADLEAWRQVFARALRDRGVEAEATPRRARGVTLKPERMALRKIRERHEHGQGASSRVRRAAYQAAARAAFQGETVATAWEAALLRRQAEIRALYLAQASLLRRSEHETDRALAARVETFVQAMPRPDSLRLALARDLRDANAILSRPARSADPGPERTK